MDGFEIVCILPPLQKNAIVVIENNDRDTRIEISPRGWGIRVSPIFENSGVPMTKVFALRENPTVRRRVLAELNPGERNAGGLVRFRMRRGFWLLALS
jgi:hypothetical protein